MSGAVSISAWRLDGREYAVKNIKSLTVTEDLSSPAISMSAAFAPDSPPPELGALKVVKDGRILFEGRVDRQSSTVSSAGIVTRLEARSAGALLLDNQAMPGVIVCARLSVMFKYFIQPYGFLLYNPAGEDKKKYLSMYTIRSGISAWDAFVQFTRRVYGITPYVSGTQIMLERPKTAAPVVISNTGSGLRYTAFTHTYSPYSILSRIVLRDDRGMYSSEVKNSAAARTQTRRQRYIIPPNEYVDNPGLNANQRIRKSMLDYEQLLVTLPGAVDVPPAQEAQIVDREIQIYNLMVVKREYLLDESGFFTRLTLKSSVYYG